MRRLLASPLHWPLSRWFLLLSWAGPRTGKLHTIPISYVTDVDQSAEVHARLFGQHPFFRRLAGIPATNGRPDAGAIRRALAAGESPPQTPPVGAA